MALIWCILFLLVMSCWGRFVHRAGHLCPLFKVHFLIDIFLFLPVYMMKLIMIALIYYLFDTYAIKFFLKGFTALVMLNNSNGNDL